MFWQLKKKKQKTFLGWNAKGLYAEEKSEKKKRFFQKHVTVQSCLET